MRPLIGVFTAFCALAGASTSTAWAQGTSQPTQVGATERTPTYLEVPVRAPADAFEIGVSMEYTQPFGDIGDDRPIGNVVGPGIGFGLDLAYRIDPRWAIGWHGGWHESAVDDVAADTTSVRGGTAGVQATYHVAPYQRVDPYISLGTGYRVLWLNQDASGDAQTVHGLQLGQLRLGLDFRASQDVAIGPYVGADVNLFLAEDPGRAANRAIPNKDASSFIYAGVAARFDVGGTRVPTPPAVSTAPRPYLVSEQPPPARTITPPPAPDTDRTQLYISHDILVSCGIANGKAYFDFDSARVTTDDRGVLDQLATCMTDGPLKGRRIVIVGRADPRGTEEYNQALGEARAQSVASYLASQGVESPRIGTMSRGEADATGKESRGWAYDRRVDIRLEE